MHFRTRAPFFVGNRWVWLVWDNHTPSKHAAIIDKARDIDADRWDFGQADHDEASRCNY